MLKAIAIDDEPMALEVIRALAEKVPFLSMQGFFVNAFEGIAFLQKNETDLMFLDIKMPDISGTELVKTLQQPPMVIFTTAYSEHAVQSFELDAIDYLLKPFSLARFLKACNKANEQFEMKRRSSSAPARPRTIFIKSGYEQIRLDLDDIRYAESSGNYVQFVTDKQKVMSRLTMTEAEALLPGADFIRIHRSFIVSKKYITKIERRSIWVGPTELPVGAVYLGEIEKLHTNP
jgi:DNA-binding LytR/AlgR family response regulator